MKNLIINIWKSKRNPYPVTPPKPIKPVPPPPPLFSLIGNYLIYETHNGTVEAVFNGI